MIIERNKKDRLSGEIKMFTGETGRKQADEFAEEIGAKVVDINDRQEAKYVVLGHAADVPKGMTVVYRAKVLRDGEETGSRISLEAMLTWIAEADLNLVEQTTDQRAKIVSRMLRIGKQLVDAAQGIDEWAAPTVEDTEIAAIKSILNETQTAVETMRQELAMLEGYEQQRSGLRRAENKARRLAKQTEAASR